jgi:hypothetical protein
MKSNTVSTIIFAALALVFALIFIWPNYSDYRAASQAGEWLVAVNSCEINAKSKNIPAEYRVFLDSALGNSPNVALFHQDSNSIMLVGSKYKQTLILWRDGSPESGYRWKCKGYPDGDVPSRCRSK